MSQKSRILILTTAYLPQVGGSELAIKNITDRLPEICFDLITSRPSKKFPKFEKIGNVNVYRAGGLFGVFSFLMPKSFLPIAVFFKARLLILKQGPYNLVHAYQASQAAGGGWLLKWLYPGIPFLLTMQEGKNLSKKNTALFFRNLIIKKADIITAISHYLAEHVNKINHKAEVLVIPNGVDVENFSRNFDDLEINNLKKRLGISFDEKVVISASRPVEKNGLDLLIEAVALLNKQKAIKTKLILVGADPVFDKSRKIKLQKITEKFSIENKVVFLDVVNHMDLPLYFSVSDVFVRPSRSEGLGNAFLEAMAARLPVIGTNVGGIPDFLKDRETGLFSTLNPEDIASKIKLIFENDKLSRHIIGNASDLVSDNYNWNKIADKFSVLYNRFL